MTAFVRKRTAEVCVGRAQDEAVPGENLAEDKIFRKIVFSLFEKHYSTKAIQEVIPDCDAFVVNQLREEWGVLEREEKFHRD